MKLSLPGLIKRKQDKGAEPEQQPDPELPVGRASLGRVRFQLLMAGVLLPGLLATGIFHLMSVNVSQALERDTGKTTDQVAARVETLVGFYLANMGLLARDPSIADLLMAGDRDALREREESLGYLFPKAINLQLLPPGIEEVDMEASPPLSYAALAQMRESETGDQAPKAEVHLFNTPQQHINIIQGVMDPAGSGVVGYLMLSLSSEVLGEMLGGVRHINGHVELQQMGAKGAPLAIASHGDRQYRDGAPGGVQEIDGSRWRVAYWPAQSGMDYLGRVSLWVIAAFLLTAGTLVIYTLVLFRRVLSALHQDQVSLVSLLKDFRDGQVHREYPYGLAEMEETLDFMTRLAGGHRAVVAPAAVGTEREQDEEYTAGNEAVDEIAPDFATLRGDSMIVEEGPLDIEPGEEEKATVDASIFRAYDIRGVVDQTLTRDTVKLIGRAIGSEAIQRGRQTVVVARDGRLSGPMLSGALVAGLRETGCNVKDIGMVPTPVLYFAAQYLDTQTGVMVTGSHNPPEYNGLKIVIDGETLSGDSIQSLRERIEAGNFISGQGSVEMMNVAPDYIERIRGDVSVEKPLRVVLDCGNGVAGGVAPQLLQEIGCEVIDLFCDIDGTFPNHHPDPSKPENLKDLISSLRLYEADIGLAFDGDGDRLGVVTAEGDIIWPDRVMMLFAADILDRNPGGQIIYDVKCSRFLDNVIREHGGEPLMWKTGHSFIKAKIKETGALLAGEMSGHIFFKERWYGFDDGLYAAARLLEILGKDERAPSEVFASLPDSVNTPELNVSMQEGEPQKFIERLLASAHLENARISTIDGLRADFEDGWGLVRASNTTPVLVLRFEADDQLALSRIMDEFRRVMQQVDPGLSLPF